MRTLVDQDQILYDLIKGSALDSATNGGLYKVERPTNSALEDIVVSSMLTTDGTLQDGVSNVNIYVSKKNQNIGGTVQLMRDSKRISELEPIAATVLKESYGDFYSLWVSKIQEFDETEINQTRLSFRIEFRLDNN